MTIRDANGNALSKTDLMAQTTSVPEADPKVTVDARIYETYPLSGEADFESGRRLLFHAGAVVPQSRIDRLFPAATVTSVNPNSGAAAGGDVVTINGSNLAGVTGVTFGGAAATGVQVLSDDQVQATTPAGAAGPVDVVVSDDSGDVTLTGGFTYV